MDGNIQEGLVTRSDDVTVKRPVGLKSAVEILMFTFYFSKTLSDTVIVNIMERNTCLVVLNYNFTNCTDPISPSTEGRIQQNTANLLMARSVTEAFIPSLLSLFIGPWSDTNGRRPLLLVCLTGYTISTAMWCSLSVIPRLHPLYFLLPSIPVALSGGYTSFFLALYCYISDITEYDKRAFRMASVMAGCLGGILLSSLIAPYLLQTSTEYGYTVVFATSFLLMVLTFLYTYNCVPESVSIIDSERSQLWSLDHVKEIFTTCFKEREKNIRTIVLLIIVNLVIYLILVEGEIGVVYLYLQRQFHWDLVQYTRLTAVVIVSAGSSVICSTWILSSYLRIGDMKLMFIGTFCLMGKGITQAVATSGIYFYASSAFSVISVLITPLSRSQLSKLIPAEDLGKIFAFTSFLESTAPLAASPLYTFVYNSTIQTFPNGVFWLSTGISGVSVVLIGSAFLLQNLSSRDDFDPLIDDEDEDRRTAVQRS